MGDEFGNYGGEPLYLAFNTGIVVSAQYGGEGTWIVEFHGEPTMGGDAEDIIHTPFINASDNNYSDTLEFTTAATRMFANKELAVAQRMASGGKPPKAAFQEAIQELTDTLCCDSPAMEVVEWLRVQMEGAESVAHG